MFSKFALESVATWVKSVVCSLCLAWENEMRKKVLIFSSALCNLFWLFCFQTWALTYYGVFAEKQVVSEVFFV